MMLAALGTTLNRALPDTVCRTLPKGSTIREEQLIRKAQQGDLEAFNELILAYQDIAYRQALWMLNDEASAEDATQEVFLKAYLKIYTFKGGPFKPWLLRIVTNYCLDQLRIAKRRFSQPLRNLLDDEDGPEPSWVKDPGDSPEKCMERAETSHEIAQAIQKLAPDYRTAIILADLQEMDYIGAAGVLNIPVGTFKSRLSRARLQLRDHLSSLNHSHMQKLNK